MHRQKSLIFNKSRCMSLVSIGLFLGRVRKLERAEKFFNKIMECSVRKLLHFILTSLSRDEFMQKFPVRRSSNFRFEWTNASGGEITEAIECLWNYGETYEERQDVAKEGEIPKLNRFDPCRCFGFDSHLFCFLIRYLWQTVILLTRYKCWKRKRH